MHLFAQPLVLSHFQALALFAFFTSAVFAVISHRTWRERAKEFLWTFLLFVVIGVGLGWVMYLFSR